MPSSNIDGYCHGACRRAGQCSGIDNQSAASAYAQLEEMARSLSTLTTRTRQPNWLAFAMPLHACRAPELTSNINARRHGNWGSHSAFAVTGNRRFICEHASTQGPGDRSPTVNNCTERCTSPTQPQGSQDTFLPTGAHQQLPWCPDGLAASLLLHGATTAAATCVVRLRWRR